MAPNFDPTERRARFRALHESACFVLPNPWDAGSAKYFESAGFQALASTSSGCAWAAGEPDNYMGLDETLAHLARLAESTTLPINADFRDGFGRTPAEVADAVTRAIGTGIAGLSIEDSTPGEREPLRPIPEAVERIRAARAAIDAAGGDVLLIGRAENFVVDRPDIDDAIARLKAYADAGADVLYAPGISTREQIEAVVKAVAPKPVNVLMHGPSEFTVADLEAMGVRRISIGGALARVAWGAVFRATELLKQGSFAGLEGGARGSDLDALFSKK